MNNKAKLGAALRTISNKFYNEQSDEDILGFRESAFKQACNAYTMASLTNLIETLTEYAKQDRPMQDDDLVRCLHAIGVVINIRVLLPSLTGRNATDQPWILRARIEEELENLFNQFVAGGTA